MAVVSYFVLFSYIFFVCKISLQPTILFIQKKSTKHNQKDYRSHFQAAIMESNPMGLPLRDNQTWGDLPNKVIKYSDCQSCVKNTLLFFFVCMCVCIQNGGLTERIHFKNKNKK